MQVFVLLGQGEGRAVSFQCVRVCVAAMEDSQEASLYKPVASWDADDVAAWVRGTRSREWGGKMEKER